MDTTPARDLDGSGIESGRPHTGEHGADDAPIDAVEREVTLSTDLREAWDLLTSPDELAGWLGAEVVLDPTPGATGEVVDHDGTRRRLVIDEVDPESRISWHWWVDGDDGETDATQVEITLSPTVDGTRVAVVERPMPGVGSITACATASVTGRAAWPHRLLHLELLVLLAAARVVA